MGNKSTSALLSCGGDPFPILQGIAAAMHIPNLWGVLPHATCKFMKGTWQHPDSHPRASECHGLGWEKV